MPGENQGHNDIEEQFNAVDATRFILLALQSLYGKATTNGFGSKFSDFKPHIHYSIARALGERLGNLQHALGHSNTVLSDKSFSSHDFRLATD